LKSSAHANDNNIEASPDLQHPIFCNLMPDQNLAQIKTVLDNPNFINTTGSVNAWGMQFECNKTLDLGVSSGEPNFQIFISINKILGRANYPHAAMLIHIFDHILHR
jgi:hypothetical protein